MTAEASIERLWSVIDDTGLEMSLSAIRIDEKEAPQLAAMGLGVTRLMKNNPRAMMLQNAEAIFHAAFRGTRR